MIAMDLDWQGLAVVAIELAAVLYLVRKLVLPAAPKPRAPDVKVSALVRKKR